MPTISGSPVRPGASTLVMSSATMKLIAIPPAPVVTPEEVGPRSCGKATTRSSVRRGPVPPCPLEPTLRALCELRVGRGRKSLVLVAAVWLTA